MDEIIAAVIAASVSLIGVIIATVVSYRQTVKHIRQSNDELQKNMKFSEQQLKVEYITNKRIEWIQNVRLLIADFITVAMDYLNYVDSLEPLEATFSGEKHRTFYHDINFCVSKMRLYLNGFDERDAEIISVSEKIVGSVGKPKDEFKSTEYYNDVILLTKLSQVYLKLEWERCKSEIESGLQEGFVKD